MAGMWKLEVSHNQVSSIPPMAFYGLERALWELHLNHNRLIRVPADSIALLKKLTVLNLAGKTKTIFIQGTTVPITHEAKFHKFSGFQINFWCVSHHFATKLSKLKMTLKPLNPKPTQKKCVLCNRP